MTKKNVLVFPAGSEIGLEIFKSLNFSTHFKVFGGSSVDDHAMYVYKNYIDKIPRVNDKDFIEHINTVVSDNKIDYIFPAHDSVVLKLAQAKAEGKLDCEVIAPPLETCKIARSKKLTYQKLQSIVKVPKLFQDAEQITANDYPVFLKPDVGQGSHGTYKADMPQDVVFYLKKDPSLLILEFLAGKEYTIDCFTNGKGELLVSEGRERHRIANGISVNSSTATDQRFTEMALKINEVVDFKGAWFFQVKENLTGEFVLMEIAARVAGTAGLIRCKGVNLPLLSLFDAMGYPVDIFENDYSIVIDRALHNEYHQDIAYKTVYLDFDDTVLVDSKVNPHIIAFIIQCFNKDIKVHLITRHKDTIADTLKKYKLSELFDDVISINGKQEKYDFIDSKDAIFIDDSFSERKRVFDNSHIPVFDNHMVEGLMEKF